VQNKWSRTIRERIPLFRKQKKQGCISLQEISFPEECFGGELTIGEAAFSDCHRIESLTLPNIETTLGDWCFGGCLSLRKVTFGEGIEEIPCGAFSECENISEITFSKGIRVIHDNAFESCKALKKVKLPRSLKLLAWVAFRGCDALDLSFREKWRFDDSDDTFENFMIRK
jgi:hypothetical protein